MNSIKLGNQIIDDITPPYIIAEIGVNHEGSLEKAKELIELAKEGGADAAKFQTYKADTLASVNSPAYWDRSKEHTGSQHELFQKYDCFEEKDYIALCEHCKNVGIDFISTPFDDLAVDFLNPLIPFFKIASADITNIPFLRKIASKNKPVILFKRYLISTNLVVIQANFMLALIVCRKFLTFCATHQKTTPQQSYQFGLERNSPFCIYSNFINKFSQSI